MKTDRQIREQLAEALQKVIDDLDMRARMRGDVEDGIAVLDLGNGALYRAHEALKVHREGK